MILAFNLAFLSQAISILVIVIILGIILSEFLD